jgi:hypothetical protein
MIRVSMFSNWIYISHQCVEEILPTRNTKVLFVHLSSSLLCRNLGQQQTKAAAMQLGSSGLGSSGQKSTVSSVHRLVINLFLDPQTDSPGGFRLGETINSRAAFGGETINTRIIKMFWKILSFSLPPDEQYSAIVLPFCLISFHSSLLISNKQSQTTKKVHI